MSQSETENGQVVVPVRVVNPPQPRGRREVAQTRFGQTSAARADPPVLVLPERPSRIEAYIINNNAAEIMIGQDPNVTSWLGARIPAGATSPKIMGGGPVYACIDPGTGTPTDRFLVSSVDIYLVPFDQVKGSTDKRKKGRP